jgi:hypothetical protein
VEEPGQIHRGDQGIFFNSVVREGLADEHSRIVDQAVDPCEPIESLLHHVPSGLSFGDVTPHRDIVVLVGSADGA